MLVLVSKAYNCNGQRALEPPQRTEVLRQNHTSNFSTENRIFFSTKICVVCQLVGLARVVSVFHSFAVWNVRALIAAAAAGFFFCVVFVFC